MAGSRAARLAFLTSSSALFTPSPDPGRPPRQLHEGLWLFAPNRHTQGGSSWLVQGDAGRGEPDVLVDAPALTAANRDWLARRRAAVGIDGGLIVLTSREGHGQIRQLQELLGWPVLVQEQEAYLLPGLQRLHRFGAEHALTPQARLLWTPGPSPGACVLLAGADDPRGSLLFCGRLLSPLAPGLAGPLRTSRSFHWGRWLRSLERLRAWLPAEAPGWLASGAGLGALRGEKLVPAGRSVIDGLDLKALGAQLAG